MGKKASGKNTEKDGLSSKSSNVKAESSKGKEVKSVTRSKPRSADQVIAESPILPSKQGSYTFRTKRGVPSFKKVDVIESKYGEIVGKKVKVYLADTKTWVTGKIEAYDSKRKIHKVLYDDGEKIDLDLKLQRFELETMPGEAFTFSGSKKRKRNEGGESSEPRAKSAKKGGSTSDVKEEAVKEKGENSAGKKKNKPGKKEKAKTTPKKK